MNDLVAVDTGELVAVDNTPIDIERELDNYRAMQRTLDRALPDAIMTIQGKAFRKKAYWRAVAKWARVSVSIQHENWHDGIYTAVARAQLPDGTFCEGDGSCAEAEKKGAMRTFHNIRAHAITRAKNRAISDLVGFGEVSAEELTDEDRRPPSQVDQYAKLSPQTRAGEPKRAQAYMDDYSRNLKEGKPQPAPKVNTGENQPLGPLNLAVLRDELSQHGKTEAALCEYLGRDALEEMTADEKPAAWVWIKAP